MVRSARKTEGRVSVELILLGPASTDQGLVNSVLGRIFVEFHDFGISTLVRTATATGFDQHVDVWARGRSVKQVVWRLEGRSPEERDLAMHAAHSEAIVLAFPGVTSSRKARFSGTRLEVVLDPRWPDIYPRLFNLE